MINKDWSSVLAVCFDGASSMSGNVGGVQAKCKEQRTLRFIRLLAYVTVF